MKKLLTILLGLCLLAALCACGSQPQSGQDAPGAQTPGNTDTPAAENMDGSETGGGDAFDDGVEMTAEEIETLETGYTGAPDLSGLTEEEILARYKAGTPDEGAFSTYEAAMFSTELFAGEEAYPREEGEWTDYDPGDWAPGEDIVAEIDVDWDAAYGEEGGQLSSGLPEQYAFLLPDGLRSGDVAMEEDGEFILSLRNRTKDEYEELVQRVKDAGYTQGASELDAMGIVMYEASDGRTGVTLMYQNGTVMASFQ